jgi:hypothetical protein
MKDVEKRVKLIVWTAETVGGRKRLQMVMEP